MAIEASGSEGLAWPPDIEKDSISWRITSIKTILIAGFSQGLTCDVSADVLAVYSKLGKQAICLREGSPVQPAKQDIL